MKKHNILFMVTIVGMMTSVGIIGTYAKISDPYKTKVLRDLEQEKETFEKKQAKVPKGLLKKIEFEKQYSQKVFKDLVRLEKEEIDNQFKHAAKDEKGNPAVEEKKQSSEIKGALVKNKYLIKVNVSPDFKKVPQLYSNYELTAQAFINNVMVFSGNRKENSNTGFIAYVTEDKEQDTLIVKELKFEEKGPIRLEEILGESGIIEFTYANGKSGFFDTNNLEVVFN